MNVVERTKLMSQIEHVLNVNFQTLFFTEYGVVADET